MKVLSVRFIVLLFVSLFFFEVTAAFAKYRTNAVVRTCEEFSENTVHKMKGTRAFNYWQRYRTITELRRRLRNACVDYFEYWLKDAINSVELKKSDLTLEEASIHNANLSVTRTVEDGKVVSTLGTAGREPQRCSSERSYHVRIGQEIDSAIPFIFKKLGLENNPDQMRKIRDQVRALAEVRTFGYEYPSPTCEFRPQPEKKYGAYNSHNIGSGSITRESEQAFGWSEVAFDSPGRGFDKFYNKKNKKRGKRYKRYQKRGQRNLRKLYRTLKKKKKSSFFSRSLELPNTPTCNDGRLDILVLAADFYCGQRVVEVCGDVEIDNNGSDPLYTDGTGQPECHATATSPGIPSDLFNLPAGYDGSGNGEYEVLAQTSINVQPGESVRFISYAPDVWPCSGLTVPSDGDGKVVVVTSTAISGWTLQDYIDNYGILETPDGQIPLRETLAPFLDLDDNIIIPDNWVIVLYELGVGSSPITNDYNDYILLVKSDCDVVNSENHRKNSYGLNATGSNYTANDTYPFTDGTRVMPSVYQSGPLGGFDDSFNISATPMYLHEEQYFFSADAVFAAAFNNDEWRFLNDARFVVWPKEVWDSGEPLLDNTVYVTEPLNFGSNLPNESPPLFGGISSPNAASPDFRSLSYRFISGDFTAFMLPPGDYMVGLLSGNVLSFELAQSMIDKSGGIASGDRYFDYNRWFNFEYTLLYETEPDYPGTLALDAYYFTMQ